MSGSHDSATFDPEVLVVGAGPVGLTLACELAWRGVRIRIVDQADGPSVRSKAVGVIPRTLELLERHSGVVSEIIGRGVTIRRIALHTGRRVLGRLDLGSLDSAYPFIVSIPQSDTEAVLLARLKEFGVQVEWARELCAVKQDQAGVEARLLHNGAVETVRPQWLAGCDGVHSRVREAAGIAFEGERYGQAFNLADLDIDWDYPRDEAQLFMSPDGVVFTVPLPGSGQRVRLIADEAPGSADVDKPDPTVADVRTWLTERTGQAPRRIAEAIWTSRFRVQRRLASTYRSGRILIAGDAAHVHSPAGAQGMNGGIQDAVNLGWKLAAWLQDSASDALIDSYTAERRRAAKAIVEGTDRLTKVATLRGPLRWLRNVVMPVALGIQAVRARAVRLQTGMSVDYRTSPLLTGSGEADASPPSAAIRAGDRAPDVTAGKGRLYDRALAHPGHTLLVLATAKGGGRDSLSEAADALKRRWGDRFEVCFVDETGEAAPGNDASFPDPSGRVRAAYGLTGGGLCLVRPDRYIACVAKAPAPVEHYLEKVFGIIDRRLEP